MGKRKHKSKACTENDVLSFIPTKSSLLKNNALLSFNATVFENHKTQKKKEPNMPDEASTSTNPTENLPERKEIDMKKARFEIMKFGMSGFDSKKKEQAKVQLAINLGAKPQKNKYKNYKELLVEKKKKQIVVEKQKKMQELGKTTFGMSNAKGKSFDRKRRKERGGLLEIYGTVKPKIGSKRRKS